MTAAPDLALVLIAHGSRASEANEAHAAMAAAVGAQLGVPVVAAFLELAEPSIGAGIDAAVATGASRVLVLPHFLYPGRHVARDIPEEVAASIDRHPDVAVEVLAASGSDAAIVDLLVAQARGAMER